MSGEENTVAVSELQENADNSQIQVKKEKLKPHVKYLG